MKLNKLHVLLDALILLSPREERVIRFRFGLPAEGELADMDPDFLLGEISRNAHTIEQTALEFGLSAERVRQIERKMTFRLRRTRMPEVLRKYLEE